MTEQKCGSPCVETKFYVNCLLLFVEWGTMRNIECKRAQRVFFGICVMMMFMTVSVAASQYNVLYSFKGGSDGFLPDGGVILDSKENLYGATALGGTDDAGTIYTITKSGTETVLYSLCDNGGDCRDGILPDASLIRDHHGNLYGTASGGGPNAGGVAFKLSPKGRYKRLHDFGAGKDGFGLAAGLIFDSAGDFYGTTYEAATVSTARCTNFQPEAKRLYFIVFAQRRNAPMAATHIRSC